MEWDIWNLFSVLEYSIISLATWNVKYVIQHSKEVFMVQANNFKYVIIENDPKSTVIMEKDLFCSEF